MFKIHLTEHKTKVRSRICLKSMIILMDNTLSFLPLTPSAMALKQVRNNFNCSNKLLLVVRLLSQKLTCCHTFLCTENPFYFQKNSMSLLLFCTKVNYLIIFIRLSYTLFEKFPNCSLTFEAFCSLFLYLSYPDQLHRKFRNLQIRTLINCVLVYLKFTHFPHYQYTNP